MSIKKKMGLGLASAALGLSLVGGGTYAYFSDTEVNASSFAAGTLDINVKGNDTANAIIDVKNIKPGDTMLRTFKLNNVGSLDVSKVILSTDYDVEDAKGDNDGEDLGYHIKVKFLKNIDKGLGLDNIIHETTLAKLREYDAVENKNILEWLGVGERDGLKAGDSDTLVVAFEFVDNGRDQNIFQGDSLSLEWTFEAHQTKGSIK